MRVRDAKRGDARLTHVSQWSSMKTPEPHPCESRAPNEARQLVSITATAHVIDAETGARRHLVLLLAG